jgi:hypothetical protein
VNDWTQHEPPPDTTAVTVRKVGDDASRTVRDNAVVTVKKAVDGTVKRRGRGPAKAKPQLDTHIKVRDDVWAAAKAVCMTSQRIVIVSETEVWVVNQ